MMLASGSRCVAFLAVVNGIKDEICDANDGSCDADRLNEESFIELEYKTATLNPDVGNDPWGPPPAPPPWNPGPTPPGNFEK